MSGKLDISVKSTSSRQSWELILLGLCLVMTIQIIRVFLTSLVYAFGERYGQTLAAVPALLVFASPLLVVPLTQLFGTSRSLVAAIGGLAVLRWLMQVSRDVNLNLVFAAIAIVLALAALTLGLSWASTRSTKSATRLAQGILLGLSVETALHGAFLTWDYLWQPGVVPLLVATLVSVLTLIALWQVRADLAQWQPAEPSLAETLPLAALSGFFVLELLFFQNVAFVASSGLVSMEAALAVVLFGDALAIAVLGFGMRLGSAARIAAAGVLVAIAALLPNIAGTAVIALVVAGQAITAALVLSALQPVARTQARSSIRNTTFAIGLGSLLFSVLIILYYISTLITLPFSYTVLPPVAAFPLLLAAIASPRVDDAPNWRLALLPLVFLMIPFALLLTRPPVGNAAAKDNFRLMNYNTHQAITFDGWLDPEGLAQVIEAQQPDVIALQEISRGWVIAGSLDVAEWLSRRLQMPVVYAPGHDYQFGNSILTRLPVAEWSFTRLPLHNVPLGRALVMAKIDLGGGKALTLINTHLSAYASTESRIPQVQKVIEVWNRRSRTLIVGDMNAHPGDQDMALYLDAGFASAQDIAGDTKLMTFTSAHPVERIDWILGTPDVEFREFSIPNTRASDHLPLFVNVRVR